MIKEELEQDSPFKKAIYEEKERYIRLRREFFEIYPFVRIPYESRCGQTDSFRIYTSIDSLSEEEKKIHYEGRIFSARIEALEDILRYWDKTSFEKEKKE